MWIKRIFNNKQELINLDKIESINISDVVTTDFYEVGTPHYDIYFWYSTGEKSIWEYFDKAEREEKINEISSILSVKLIVDNEDK